MKYNIANLKEYFCKMYIFFEFDKSRGLVLYIINNPFDHFFFRTLLNKIINS